MELEAETDRQESCRSFCRLLTGLSRPDWSTAPQYRERILCSAPPLVESVTWVSRLEHMVASWAEARLLYLLELTCLARDSLANAVWFCSGRVDKSPFTQRSDLLLPKLTLLTTKREVFPVTQYYGHFGMFYYRILPLSLDKANKFQE